MLGFALVNQCGNSLFIHFSILNLCDNDRVVFFLFQVLSELNYDDVDIGIKRFGAIDTCPFRAACKQKFSHQVAEEKATELCSIWQANVENPKWNPFKTVTLSGEVQAVSI